MIQSLTPDLNPDLYPFKFELNAFLYENIKDKTKFINNNKIVKILYDNPIYSSTVEVINNDKIIIKYLIIILFLIIKELNFNHLNNYIY